jgi:hypothetical protein
MGKASELVYDFEARNLLAGAELRVDRSGPSDTARMEDVSKADDESELPMGEEIGITSD